MELRADRRTDGWTNGHAGGQTDTRADKRTHRRTDGETEGQTDTGRVPVEGRHVSMTTSRRFAAVPCDMQESSYRM